MVAPGTTHPPSSAPPPTSVLVVGACAAGLSTAEALRRRGYEGHLTLLGDEAHAPYDRPPLSKQVLEGAWEVDRCRLRPDTALAALDADLVLGDRAVSLDAATRTVRTAAGRRLSADAVVVATGLRARTLPGAEGAHVLRTVDDCVALHAELGPDVRLLVVGDGVLGLEVAATAARLGTAVTVVGRQPTAMAAQLGPVVAAVLGRTHTDHGVRFLPGRSLGQVSVRAGRVAGAVLDDGTAVDADVVVVAIGGEPAVDWLDGSGLDLTDGVVCDSAGRSADGVWAAGDVARWFHPGLGTHLRQENRTNATEQAAVVAAGILGDPRGHAPVPYSWTDQFEARIAVFGTPTATAATDVVEGDPAAGRFVAVLHEDDGPVAVVGWNMPKQARRHRELLLPRFAA